MNNWEILGIQPTANEREIKKAYARQTKIHHPETDPEGFQLVYKAYQRILKTTNISKHIEVIPFDSNVLSERKVFQKEEKRVPSRNLKNEQYNIYKDIENEQYEKLKNSEKGKSKKSRNNKDDIYKNIENEQHEKIKKIEKDQQEREKQYFELVFDNLIDFVEEEKRNYYNRPAMVEFRKIFLDPNKIYYQDPWRKYFESFQFLEIQYDGKFIKYLTEFLEEQQEVEIRKLPKNLYIELCTAYGIMTDSEVYKFADVKPLIDIMNIHYLKTDYTYMMTKHKEILERRYSFYMYISLVKEYEIDATNTVIYWIKILEDLTYEVSKKANKRITINHSKDMIYPDINRIPLIFELLTHFLEIHKPISKELHYAFYLLFEKQTIRNGGDELEIMRLTLRDMRSTEVQQYITHEYANGKNLEYVKNLELEEKKPKREKGNELVYTRVIFNESKMKKPKIKRYSIG